MAAKGLRSKEAAAHCEIAWGTWRQYVHTKHAPEHDYIDNEGRKRWFKYTLNQWMASRPGRGFRSDIHGRTS